MKPHEVRALPVVVDVPTAGSAFNLGRDLSYKLAHAGQFPVPVLRLGRRLVVTRSALMAALGIEDAPAVPRIAHTSTVPTLVNASASDARSDARAA